MSKSLDGSMKMNNSYHVGSRTVQTTGVLGGMRSKHSVTDVPTSTISTTPLLFMQKLWAITPISTLVFCGEVLSERQNLTQYEMTYWLNIMYYLPISANIIEDFVR